MIWDSTYRYQTIGDDEIRLLLLYPEGPEGRSSELRGQLKTFLLSVERGEYIAASAAKPSAVLSSTAPPGVVKASGKHGEAPVYHALSYTWGGDPSVGTESSQYLHIFDLVESRRPGQNGLTNHTERGLGHLKLTNNLAEALRTFRAELKKGGPPLLIWIDSVCIWQDGNHYEKSTQIGKMADIYTEAATVKVWLGQGKEAFSDVRGFIQQILTLDKFDEMCKDTGNASKWDALRNLMQSPWFHRRWIVQEIAFAREATVHWGPYVIPWNEFASAIQLFASKRSTIRKMFQKSNETNHNPDLIGELEAYGAKNLVDTIDKMLRKSEDGDIMELLLSLESILTSMTAFDVSKPHDVVYSILQLSNDARPASERTIRQEIEPKNRQTEPLTDAKIPHEITFNLSEHISASPERVDGTQRPSCVDDSEIINSANEWAGDGLRGRPIARDGPASKHLAVRGDLHFRSRSRGRSPMVAKTIAERAFRKPRDKFVVDYDQSVLKLCTEVTNFVVKESKSLDLICQPWAPRLSRQDREESEHDDDKGCYPSWIRSTSTQAFGIRNIAGNKKSVRIGADSLAGPQHNTLKTYNASGIVPHELPRSIQLTEGRILNARGFVLDKIDKIAEPAVDATIPARWLRLGWDDKRRAGVESLPPEAFWRTLVANRVSTAGTIGPPLYWRQACQWAFSQQAVNGNLNTGELLHNLALGGAVSKPVGEFLHRVRAVIWDRALIRTENNAASIGFLGLAPKEAEVGDLICILYGCSVPVVLRPKVRRYPERDPSATRRRKQGRSQYIDERNPQSGPTRSRSTPNDPARSMTQNGDSSMGSQLDQFGTNKDLDREEYSLIGECYIHGMMDGEAFSQLEKATIDEKEKTFRIGCGADCTCRRCDPDRGNCTME